MQRSHTNGLGPTSPLSSIDVTQWGWGRGRSSNPCEKCSSKALSKRLREKCPNFILILE